MSGLPDWLNDLAGFDPSAYWTPIVCMGREVRSAHTPEMIGVYFDSSTGGRMWAGQPAVDANGRTLGFCIVPTVLDTHYEYDDEEAWEHVEWWTDEGGQHVVRTPLPELAPGDETTIGTIPNSRNRGPGSIETSCPACEVTHRVDRDEWARWLQDQASDTTTPWINTSLLP